MGFQVKMWIKKADGSCASDFSEYILEKNGHEQAEERTEKSVGKCLGDFQREDVRLSRAIFSQ